jgi:hypothetical protein
MPKDVMQLSLGATFSIDHVKNHAPLVMLVKKILHVTSVKQTAHCVVFTMVGATNAQTHQNGPMKGIVRIPVRLIH